MAKSPAEKSPSKAKTAAKAPAAKATDSKPAVPLAAAPVDTAGGKLVFDGVEYAFDSLSEEARNHIQNMQACDQEIARLKMQQAITQTARMAYAFALKQTLPQAA